MYRQTEISFPPGNFGTNHTAKLEGGTGSLNFSDGQMYTVLLVNTGGNMLINTTQDAIPGEVIAKGELFQDSDLRFSLKASASSTTMITSCIGDDYPTVVLNGKTWLAQNLNCELSGRNDNGCSDDPGNGCEELGRFYTFEAAQAACTQLGNGWRVPTQEDWEDMMESLDADLDLSIPTDYENTTNVYAALTVGGNTNFNATTRGGIETFDGSGNLGNIETTGSYWSSNTKQGDQKVAFIFFGTRINNTWSEQVLKMRIDKVNGLNCRCIKD